MLAPAPAARWRFASVRRRTRGRAGSLSAETDAEDRAIETIRGVPFGDVTHEPNEVEGLLRRAQLTVSNPQIERLLTR